MARTSSAGFFPRKGLYGSIDGVTKANFIIANSSTVTIGDALTLNDTGFCRRAAAGEAILGVCLGLITPTGLNPFTPQASGYTTGSTLTEDDTIAVSSTNQSDATRNISAEVYLDPAGVVLYYNDSSGTLAATNDLQFFDNDADADQVDQTSALDTNGQWQLVSRDPDGDGDASKGLFRIAEGQLGGIIDSATDKLPT